MFLIGPSHSTYLALNPTHLIPLYKNDNFPNKIKEQSSIYDDAIKNECYDDKISVVAKYKYNDNDIPPKIDSHNELYTVFLL